MVEDIGAKLFRQIGLLANPAPCDVAAVRRVDLRGRQFSNRGSKSIGPDYNVSFEFPTVSRRDRRDIAIRLQVFHARAIVITGFREGVIERLEHAVPRAQALGQVEMGDDRPRSVKGRATIDVDPDRIVGRDTQFLENGLEFVMARDSRPPRGEVCLRAARRCRRSSHV